MPVARQYAVVGLVLLITTLLVFQNPYYSPPVPSALKQYIPTFGDGVVERPTAVNDDYGPEADKYVVAPDSLHSHFADFGEFDPASKNLPETTEQFNQHILRDLHHCMAVGNCGRNQKKIVIIVGEWVVDCVVHGGRGGEAIWTLSVMRALKQLGYTYLIAWHHENALELYRLFPNMVQIVMGWGAGDCFNHESCIKHDRKNPTGIPRHKIFDMEYFYWGGSGGDAGEEWALHGISPGPSNSEFNHVNVLGYSLEDQCDEFERLASGADDEAGDDSALSAEELERDSNSVWLFTKQLTYIYSHYPEFPWNRTYFERATEDLHRQGYDQFSFKGAYRNDPGYLPDRIETAGPEGMVELDGVRNMGQIGPKQFAKELAKTKMLVGIGQPWLAPSVQLALCLKTPFLNPVKVWDVDNPSDRTKWITQHNSFAHLDPPYVYHVFAGDYDGFVEAIRGALDNPLKERYLPESATDAGMRKKMHHLLTNDWASLARERWEKLKADGKDPMWTPEPAPGSVNKSHKDN